MSIQKHRSGETALTGRKTLLSCPVCDHRSPVDGDWAVTESEAEPDADATSRLTYECPQCGHTVVVQPVFDPERTPSTA
jgi:DNA-directed RNA polymerase subunit RPC12/RpoP